MIDHGLIYNQQNDLLTAANPLDHQNKQKIGVDIGNICADSPARNFILGTKHHTGNFGCGRCNTEGEYLEHRTCFPELTAVLRSDETFENKIHEDHHKTDCFLKTINLK